MQGRNHDVTTRSSRGHIGSVYSIRMADLRMTSVDETAPLPDAAARSVLARRAAARGTAGAVASSSPTASALGVAALLDGGNCVDAALAAALAEGVVLAPKCGLGGDVVALYLAPESPEPVTLVSVGRAPERLAEVVRSSGHLPATGGLSLGVPGAPAGYAALAEAGRLGLARLCAPAISLARRGFAWSPQCAALAAEADALLTRYQPDGCRFRPCGGPLAVGERVKLPGLATVLEAFAHDGADLFDGRLGEAVVTKAGAHGGIIAIDDFSNVAAEWAPPPSLAISSATIWTTPGPTYGPALLGSLGSYQLGRSSLPEVVHASLTRQANTAGDGVAFETEGTSVVAATDAEGGAVVIVHSNSFPQFGSGLVVEELDLILSNRAGRGFSSDPTRPNFPDASRRPLTTLHCWAMRCAGRMLLGGTPGGAQQVAWNAQVLSRLLSGDEPGNVVTGPLWQLEAGVTVAESDSDLAAPETVGPLTMRSSQVIVAPPGREGVCSAWADPRGDALAVAL